jgi:8-oxo-dGTP diphosphatase
MTSIRRKGVAIVETKKGILVVAGKNKKFILPGGGAEKWESRKKAAIRELYEETDLKTRKIKYIFRYIGEKWNTHKGGRVRNHAKVFLVSVEGNPRPKHEIKHIAFWNTSSKIRISGGTRRILEKYLTEFKD